MRVNSAELSTSQRAPPAVLRVPRATQRAPPGLLAKTKKNKRNKEKEGLAKELLKQEKLQQELFLSDSQFTPTPRLLQHSERKHARQ
jgi:hypothetical protein